MNHLRDSSLNDVTQGAIKNTVETASLPWQGFGATTWLAKQVWEASPTHWKGSKFCGEYTLWQIGQANLSLARLWCYLKLWWICLNCWRSSLTYLMTTHLVIAPSSPQGWNLHLKLQVVKSAGQNHPEKTKPEQQHNSPNQANNRVSLNRICSLGSPNPPKSSCPCRGRGSRGDAALCMSELLLSS